MSKDLSQELYEAFQGKSPEDKDETQKIRDAEAAEKKAELDAKMSDPVWRFCYDHYYCEPMDADGYREKWGPFEHWSDEEVEEQVENDVWALRNFLKTYKHGTVKEALRGKSEDDKEATREEREKPVKCPQCKEVIKKVDAIQRSQIEMDVEGNRAVLITEDWGGDIEDVQCENCHRDLDGIIEIDL